VCFFPSRLRLALTVYCPYCFHGLRGLVARLPRQSQQPVSRPIEKCRRKYQGNGLRSAMSDNRYRGKVASAEGATDWKFGIMGLVGGLAGAGRYVPVRTLALLVGAADGQFRRTRNPFVPANPTSKHLNCFQHVDILPLRYLVVKRNRRTKLGLFSMGWML